MNKRQKKKAERTKANHVISAVEMNISEAVPVENTPKISVSAQVKAVSAEPVKVEVAEVVEQTVLPNDNDKKEDAGLKRKAPELVIQYQKCEVSKTQIENTVKKLWKNEGKLIKDIKTIDIYAKLEEGKAYYVINGGINGVLDFEECQA